MFPTRYTLVYYISSTVNTQTLFYSILTEITQKFSKKNPFELL